MVQNIEDKHTHQHSSVKEVSNSVNMVIYLGGDYNEEVRQVSLDYLSKYKESHI